MAASVYSDPSPGVEVATARPSVVLSFRSAREELEILRHAGDRPDDGQLLDPGVHHA